MSSSDNNKSATSKYSDILNALDSLEVWDWCGYSHDYPRYAADYHGNPQENVTAAATSTEPINNSNGTEDKTTSKPNESSDSSSTADTADTKDTADTPTNSSSNDTTKQPPRLGPCGNPLTTFSTEDPCLRSDKCMDGKELDEGAKKTAEQIKAKGTRVSVVNGIFH
jgi:hypothetical protein